MRKYWTIEEDNIIRNDKKNNESWREFTERELPHRTWEAVRLHALRKLNIRNDNFRPRAHTFDRTVWHTPTLESCYWAGFIAADGSLVKYTKGNGYSLKVDLQKRDSNHLVKLANFCNYTGNLQKTQQRTDNSITQMLTINCGLEWVDDLRENFSIVPRKTYTLRPPNITDRQLIEAFIIGYVDGDGTIFYNNRSSSGLPPTILIKCTTASKEFAQWLQKEFNLRVKGYSILNRERKLQTSKCNKYFYPSVHGQPACALIDYLMTVDVPRLERKWNDTTVLNYLKEQKRRYPDKFIACN